MADQNKCVSCGCDLDEKFRYCSKCMYSKSFKQCQGKTAHLSPCKLKSINLGCIYHNNRICENCKLFTDKNKLNKSKICLNCENL